MTIYLKQQALQIHPDFADFVNDEVLPLTKLNQENFWNDFVELIEHFSPANSELLAKRNDLQAQIDA